MEKYGKSVGEKGKGSTKEKHTGKKSPRRKKKKNKRGNKKPYEAKIPGSKLIAEWIQHEKDEKEFVGKEEEEEEKKKKKKKKKNPKTTMFRGRFIKKKIGGSFSVKMRRLFYEMQKQRKLNARKCEKALKESRVEALKCEDALKESRVEAPRRDKILDEFMSSLWVDDEEEDDKDGIDEAKGEEREKDRIEPHKRPKQLRPKKVILNKVFETLPYSGGRSERLLKKQIKFVISRGLVDPSKIRMSAIWWKKYVKKVKAEQKYHPLGREHPLTKKFKTIAKRYAKRRPQSLKAELGQHPKHYWPHRSVKHCLSMEKMNAEAIVKHIEKNTKQFGKIKHLFEGNFGKTCSLYGWPVQNLLILLEQLESNFSLHVRNKELIGEINRCWALKSRKLKAKNRRLKMLSKKGMEAAPEKVNAVWKALQTGIGSTSLRQSLDYAKVYLAGRCPKPHLRRLTENESLPKEIDGPSHLLEKYISEVTEELPVVPGYYYYATVFPYYKWLYDVKSSEARKDFYLKVADFFLNHQEMYPIKDKELLEPVKIRSLVSFQR